MSWKPFNVYNKIRIIYLKIFDVPVYVLLSTQIYFCCCHNGHIYARTECKFCQKRRRLEIVKYAISTLSCVSAPHLRNKQTTSQAIGTRDSIIIFCKSIGFLLPIMEEAPKMCWRTSYGDYLSGKLIPYPGCVSSILKCGWETLILYAGDIKKAYGIWNRLEGLGRRCIHKKTKWRVLRCLQESEITILFKARRRGVRRECTKQGINRKVKLRAENYGEK